LITGNNSIVISLTGLSNEIIYHLNDYLGSLEVTSYHHTVRKTRVMVIRVAQTELFILKM